GLLEHHVEVFQAQAAALDAQEGGRPAVVGLAGVLRPPLLQRPRHVPDQQGAETLARANDDLAIREGGGRFKERPVVVDFEDGELIGRSGGGGGGQGGVDRALPGGGRAGDVQHGGVGGAGGQRGPRRLNLLAEGDGVHRRRGRVENGEARL